MDALSKDEEFSKMIDVYEHESYVSKVDRGARSKVIQDNVASVVSM